MYRSIYGSLLCIQKNITSGSLGTSVKIRGASYIKDLRSHCKVMSDQKTTFHDRQQRKVYFSDRYRRLRGKKTKIWWQRILRDLFQKARGETSSEYAMRAEQDFRKMSAIQLGKKLWPV